MKKLAEKWRWLPVTASILFIVVGLVVGICVWIPLSETDISTTINTTLGYIIASLVMAVGALTFVLCLLEKPMKLSAVFFISVVLMSLAGYVYYLMATSDSSALVSNIVIIQGSIIVFALTTFIIVWAIRKLVSRSKKIFLPVLAIIAAAILITGGILLMIYIDNSIIQSIAVCLVGLLITALGIYILVKFLKKGKKDNKPKQVTKNTPPVENLDDKEDDANKKEEPVIVEVEPEIIDPPSEPTEEQIEEND